MTEIPIPYGPPPDRITMLEEAVDLLTWLHAEQRYHLNALIFKMAMANPEAVEKLKTIAAAMQLAKQAQANGNVAVVPGA